MQDLMIDIESLGTDVDAPVVAIGAVYFDLENKKIGDTFYMALDVADQIDSRKRFASAATIKWWLSQTDAAKIVFKEQAQPTKQVLELFAKWILTHAGSKAQSTKKCFPFGNGAGFDVVLLETLFRDYGVQVPWLFYNVQDLRTFKRFIGKGAKIEKLGTEHNALDDAISQVSYMFQHYNPEPIAPTTSEAT